MVEIEWDGVDLPTDARRSLRELASMVDPDGRARVQVEIVTERTGYCVIVSGQDEWRRMGAEVRDADLMGAITRALDLATSRWEAARQRAA
jgi:hypothetical protein